MARIETDPNYTAPTFSRATAATDIFKKEDVQSVAAALSTHVHDGAGKGLPIVIPANAVTQTGYAIGTTASPATTSTVYADIPEMAVTLTTVGGTLQAWLVCDVAQQSGPVSDVVFLAFSLDGAAEVGEVTYMSAFLNHQVTVPVLARFTGVAAGAHTIKGRWKVLTGTNSTLAIGVRRSLLVEEFKR